MCDKILKWLNDNHWYIVAFVIIGGVMFWTWGCESKVASIMYPERLVNREELAVEANYVSGQIILKTHDLDKQDAIKNQLLDSLMVIGQGGQINPAGAVNIAATILAIGWGLKKNQQVKALETKKPENSA